MANSTIEHRHTPDLQEVHAHVRALYAAEYPEGAPYLYERLLRKLPDYIRAVVSRKLDLLTKEECKGIDPVTGKETPTQRSHADLAPADREALSMFFDAQVLRAHYEVGRDAALSNDHHFIAHFETLLPVMAHELVTVAAGNHPERLTRTGCVFFDVNGTKTIVDCTSHAHAGKYLEALAEFLCNLPPHIVTWLRERDLKTKAFTVAGDEFIVIVESDTQPVDTETLDAFAELVQDAMVISPELGSFVSFDDPEFIMEYDAWKDEERAAYRNDPASMAEQLAGSRAHLPDRFIPSASCGSATYLEGLHEALSPDTATARTLEELGENAFRLMVERADIRLKEKKRAFREHLEDPRWKAFLLRNNENRLLLRQIEELQARLRTLLGEQTIEPRPAEPLDDSPSSLVA